MILLHASFTAQTAHPTLAPANRQPPGFQRRSTSGIDIEDFAKSIGLDLQHRFDQPLPSSPDCPAPESERFPFVSKRKGNCQSQCIVIRYRGWKEVSLYGTPTLRQFAVLNDRYL